METLARTPSLALGIASPRGEGSDWDTALGRHYPELCEFVLRIVGSREAAEDLVHDLFLHLWRTRHLGDSDRLGRPYLFAAARNRALKYLRHRRVAQAWIDLASREEPPGEPTPADECQHRELERAVARAIESLPPRCREIFLLRRREHLSYDQIAARAGVSIGTVKSHMWRAAVMLRESLAPYLALLFSAAANDLLTRIS